MAISLALSTQYRLASLKPATTLTTKSIIVFDHKQAHGYQIVDSVFFLLLTVYFCSPGTVVSDVSRQGDP